MYLGTLIPAGQASRHGGSVPFAHFDVPIFLFMQLLSMSEYPLYSSSSLELSMYIWSQAFLFSPGAAMTLTQKVCHRFIGPVFQIQGDKKRKTGAHSPSFPLDLGITLLS
jgi:hypothetical protein